MLKRKRAMIFDDNSLNCEACRLPLAPPIYQCASGHCMCSLCIDELEGKCHACSLPIDESIRNLGLERILGTLKRRCAFASYGCSKMLLYSESQMHENKCFYQPHDCPLPGCWYRGSLHDMSAHFKKFHKVRSIKFAYNEQFRVDVTPNDEYVLLLGPDEHFLFCCRNCHQVGKLLYISSFCFTSHSVASSASSPLSSASPSSSSLVHDSGNTSSAYMYKLDFVCYKSGDRSVHIFSSAAIEKHLCTSNCIDCGTLPRDFLILPKSYLVDQSEIIVSIESPSWPSPADKLAPPNPFLQESTASFESPSLDCSSFDSLW